MNIETIAALATMIGDGIFILLIAFLYLYDRKKRQKEYENERAARDKEYQDVQKAREEEYKHLNENYNNMIQDIIQGITCHHLTPEESKNIAQVEKQINDIIRQILKEANASRVSIVKYHNGNKDMTGVSFLKMSMTNEAVNMGVAPLMPDFQNQFRSLLAYWCHEVDTQGFCIIPDREELIDVDITMYEYLKARNIEAKYGRALRNTNRDVVGFICVEYLNKDDFDLEAVNKSLKDNYQRIETLIGLNGGVKNELQ